MSKYIFPKVSVIGSDSSKVLEKVIGRVTIYWEEKLETK